MATTFWLNQINKYDEYYHVHIYGGKGIQFEKSNYIAYSDASDPLLPILTDPPIPEGLTPQN